MEHMNSQEICILQERVTVLEKEIAELKRQLETRQFLKGVTFNDLMP